MQTHTHEVTPARRRQQRNVLAGGVSNLAFNPAEGVSLFAPIHARSAKLSTGMPLHLGAQPGPRIINQREQR